MDLIGKIKTNRLKAVSVLAVIGDIFMGLAGGEGLVLRDPSHTFAYSLLMISGSCALFGHLMLFVWGKGAEDKAIARAGSHKAEPPILLKPLWPWRYPLDGALFAWLLAGISYTVSGILMDDMALLFMGVTNVAACLIGWLYPKHKKFFGFSGMQMTSIMYMLSTVGTFATAWTLGSLFIFGAGCAYAACNLILYTVNKENQSAFTQQHEV